ncbi:MAG: hypothetical protein ACFCUR_02340 [Rhodomicrobiaceae bacterium]
MKRIIIAASALIVATAPAFAGGWSHQSPSSPQMANSSALNLALQVGSISAYHSTGSVKQVTGAGAESINKANCGCKGLQTANSVSKNVSIQVGRINSHHSVGSIDQSAVSTAFSSNRR